MKVSRPQEQEPTPKELQELEKLKALIDRACADGQISKQEMETIKAAIYSDGKVAVEEMELMRNLITEKIDRGELEWQWSLPQ